MKISFFEEFPSADNLEKAKLVSFPTKLYLAAPSLARFLELKKEAAQKYPLIKELVYWPVLEKKEGYWISPWAQRSALKRIFRELKALVPVMLDLELPTFHNPWLYLTQLVNFPRNKKLIKDFIRNYRGPIYLAEYYPQGKLRERMLRWGGLHYEIKKAKIIKMVYHSLHDFDEWFIRKELQRGKEEFGENFLLAYGTIAKGVNGNEPILSPAQLEKDLQLAQDVGISEVIIFRLGGLNKKYLEVLEKFAEKR